MERVKGTAVLGRLPLFLIILHTAVTQGGKVPAITHLFKNNKTVGLVVYSIAYLLLKVFFLDAFVFRHVGVIYRSYTVLFRLPQGLFWMMHVQFFLKYREHFKPTTYKNIGEI